MDSIMQRHGDHDASREAGAFGRGDLDLVVNALLEGRPAVFPTDTVWGLGVSVNHCDTAEELYKIKGRPSEKPVAWLVGGIDDLTYYGTDVPDYAMQMARMHWPGALTLIVRASSHVPEPFRAKDGSIALRMPDSKTVSALIERIGSPLAVTSANASGASPVPRRLPFDPNASGLKMDGEIAILDASGVEYGILPDDQSAKETSATSSIGVASTVVDCTGEFPRVLRQGPVQASV